MKYLPELVVGALWALTLWQQRPYPFARKEKLREARKLLDKPDAPVETDAHVTSDSWLNWWEDE